MPYFLMILFTGNRGRVRRMRVNGGAAKATGRGTLAESQIQQNTTLVKLSKSMIAQQKATNVALGKIQTGLNQLVDLLARQVRS